MDAATDPPDLPPAAWAVMLGAGISAEQVADLLSSPRLGRRFAGLLASRYRLAPPDPAVRRLASVDAAGLAQLSHDAGVVWHAGAIRRTIGRRDVEALVAGIGATAHALALRCMVPADAPPPRDVTAILHAIPADGRRCLAAWCATAPAALAAHLRGQCPDLAASAGADPARAAVVTWLLAQ